LKPLVKVQRRLTKNDYKWMAIEIVIGVGVGVLVAWWMSNECTLCWYATVRDFVLKLFN
jgi:hypothetical protein